MSEPQTSNYQGNVI